VQQYYHAVDWTKWEDVRKVLVVYQNVLAALEQTHQTPPIGWNVENAARVFASLTKWIERDGFEYRNGILSPVGVATQIAEVRSLASKFDAPALHRQIDRMEDAVEDDPALAIGTAKELVETTCKTILSDRGVACDDKWDINELIKETRRVLDLLPDDIPNAAKGAEAIRRLLSNLGAIAQGLSELRNLYGTGHGKHGSAKGLSCRHARLAVGAASTLAMFLFETHEERPK
jgi:hypothetical protein